MNLALHLSQLSGIRLINELGTYLGIPLFLNRVNRGTFEPLLVRVRGKLGGWSSHLLSKAGGRVLIQSVSSAISAYMMQVVKLPCETVELLENSNDSLFGTNWRTLIVYIRSFGTPSIHWSVMGCLGIRHVRRSNQALFAKLCWRIFHDPCKLWVQVLLCKYGDPLLPPMASWCCSHIWRVLLWVWYGTLVMRMDNDPEQLIVSLMSMVVFRWVRLTWPRVGWQRL